VVAVVAEFVAGEDAVVAGVQMVRLNVRPHGL